MSKEPVRRTGKVERIIFSNMGIRSSGHPAEVYENTATTVSAGRHKLRQYRQEPAIAASITRAVQGGVHHFDSPDHQAIMIAERNHELTNGSKN